MAAPRHRTEALRCTCEDQDMAGITHADLVLLLLGAPSEHPEVTGKVAGITRLEKLAYLVEVESRFHEAVEDQSERFNFKAYHYGPYTREIYDAVGLLVSVGLIDETRKGSDSSLDVAEELEALDSRDFGSGGDGGKPYVERNFALTPKGEYVAKVLAQQAGDAAVKQITAVKDEYGALNLRALLRRVYKAHPDMTGKSRIKNEL